jgi:hypothetical protein
MMLGEFLGWLQFRSDVRAPIIEGLLGIAMAGDPELAIQVGIDIELGRERAQDELMLLRGGLKRKIGYELVH